MTQYRIHDRVRIREDAHFLYNTEAAFRAAHYVGVIRSVEQGGMYGISATDADEGVIVGLFDADAFTLLEPASSEGRYRAGQCVLYKANGTVLYVHSVNADGNLVCSRYRFAYNGTVLRPDQVEPLPDEPINTDASPAASAEAGDDATFRNHIRALMQKNQWVLDQLAASEREDLLRWYREALTALAALEAQNAELLALVERREREAAALREWKASASQVLGEHSDLLQNELREYGEVSESLATVVRRMLKMLKGVDHA